MPLNDLYSYTIKESGDSIIKVLVDIDTQHRLYKGHFPDNPVTPGVALIEIIRQIFSDAMKKELMLTEAKDIKFIASIIPPKTSDLELEIKYNETVEGLKATCVLSGKNQIYTKLRGTFSERK